MTQFYFQVLKDIRIVCTYFFIMKIPNKSELQPIAFNHFADIDFIRLYQSLQKLKIYSDKKNNRTYDFQKFKTIKSLEEKFITMIVH